MILLDLRKRCRIKVQAIKNNLMVTRDASMTKGLEDFELILNNPNLDDVKVDAELIA